MPCSNRQLIIRTEHIAIKVSESRFKLQVKHSSYFQLEVCGGHYLDTAPAVFIFIGGQADGCWCCRSCQVSPPHKHQD